MKTTGNSKPTIPPCLLVLVIVLIPACRSSDDPGYPQSLREAAEWAGIHIGVAAAPGVQAREELIVREFNAISAEGEFLWQSIHPEPDTWNFEPADRFVEFTQAHGLFTTATHFLWDQFFDFTSVPAWVEAIDDPDELRAVMHGHMATLYERYGGAINRWIVVNEPMNWFGRRLRRNHFCQVLGPGYIAEAFWIAAGEMPESELWLNEIFAEYVPGKGEALVELAADLVADCVPIDGVGLQGHLFFGTPERSGLEETLRGLAALGLKVSFTEVDAPVLPHDDRWERQADRLAEVTAACLDVPGCSSITFWGLDDDQSWLNWLFLPGLGPLLFDAGLEPKPAYFSVLDALARAGR
ncbi:endo-1,4-beta-xylanase [Thermodesulfobacteriota bacterium]